MGFDSKYAPAAVVALFSVFANTTRRDFEVCVLGDNLDSAAMESLRQLAAIFNRQIRVVDMKAERFSRFNVSHHISRAAYSRLFAPSEIKTERMLWLDCDIVVHEDIGYLLDVEIPVGFVACGVRDVPIEAERKSKLNLCQSDIYINSGVMLIDSLTWRAEGLSQSALELGAVNPQQYRYWDQCLINKLLEGRKYPLPVKWNQMFHVFMLGMMTDVTPLDPCFRGIVHYTTDIKPWHIWSDRQFARLYKAYAHVAPSRMPVVYVPERRVDQEMLEKRLRVVDY